MVEAAEQCCTEARLLYPLSYLILFLKGEIHQVGNPSAEQCSTEARLLYPLSYLILFLKGEIHQVGHPSAEQCSTEARLLYPLSYLILFFKGEIHQLQSHISRPVCFKVRGEWELAKTCYQDSLSINPHHLSSL